jgi:branched-chain amino acid transport system substrate-binding protein
VATEQGGGKGQDAGQILARGITRRGLIRAGAVTAVGGYMLGAFGSLVRAQSATPGTVPAPSGQPLRVVGINALASNPRGSEEARNGTLLAIDEINAAGGVLGRPLEFAEVDYGNGGDPAQVRDGFTRAVETQSPDVIVAQGPTAIGPDYEVTADAGVIYLNGNTREDWRTLYESDPERYWNSFQYDPSELAYGSGFAVFINGLADSDAWDPAEKSVAIIAGDDPYGTSIATVFEETAVPLGWRVTTKEFVTAGTVVDWGPIFTKVRQDPPALFLSTTYAVSDNAAMAQQWAQAPMPQTLLYQQYGPSEPEYLELAGEAANGIIWSTVLGVQADAIGEGFRERYRAMFNKEPGWSYAGGCYDATNLWAKAAAIAGDPSDTRRVASVIEQLIHRGVTGGIHMPRHITSAFPAETPDPSLGQPTLIVQIQDGAHRVIAPAPFTNSDFQLPPWYQA